MGDKTNLKIVPLSLWKHKVISVEYKQISNWKLYTEGCDIIATMFNFKLLDCVDMYIQLEAIIESFQRKYTGSLN